MKLDEFLEWTATEASAALKACLQQIPSGVEGDEAREALFSDLHLVVSRFLGNLDPNQSMHSNGWLNLQLKAQQEKNEKAPKLAQQLLDLFEAKSVGVASGGAAALAGGAPSPAATLSPGGGVAGALFGIGASTGGAGGYGRGRSRHGLLLEKLFEEDRDTVCGVPALRPDRAVPLAPCSDQSVPPHT
jgi:hypothetical protein